MSLDRIALLVLLSASFAVAGCRDQSCQPTYYTARTELHGAPPFQCEDQLLDLPISQCQALCVSQVDGRPIASCKGVPYPASDSNLDGGAEPICLFDGGFNPDGGTVRGFYFVDCYIAESTCPD